MQRGLGAARFGWNRDRAVCRRDREAVTGLPERGRRAGFGEDRRGVRHFSRLDDLQGDRPFEQEIIIAGPDLHFEPAKG